MDPLAPPLEHNDEQNRVAPSNEGIRSPSEQQPDEDRATLHGKALAGNQQVVESKLGDTQVSGSRWCDMFGLHVGTGSTEGIHPAQGRDTSTEEDILVSMYAFG